MAGIPAEVVHYLGLHHVITISTSSFTGMPHADTVVYAADHSRLYFYADPGTSIARNIKDSRYVSFTIDDYTTDWKKLRELQGLGRCIASEPQVALVVQSLMTQKFGSAFTPPPGVVHQVEPIEMHFVDYNYHEVANQSQPDVSSRVFQLDPVAPAPSQGAVATSLDRMTFEPGQVIFRPGSPPGQYFVIVEGEVEIRTEGFGVDQTVTRARVGQLFGDRATMGGQQGALTAHAITRTVLLAVEREAMRDIMLPG